MTYNQHKSDGTCLIRTSGDQIQPGAMEFTRMLFKCRSSAMHLVTACTAPLVAEYVHLVGWALLPEMLPIFTTLHPPSASVNRRPI